MEVINVGELILDRLSNDLGPAAIEGASGVVDALDEVVRKPCGDLGHLIPP